MKQSRATSFLKSITSTAVGFVVALAANAVVLPLFGFHPSLSGNLQITCIYTVISVARGYLLDRAFEAMGWRTRMSAAAVAILAERQRQVTQEGWSESHDDEHKQGALALAGAAYVRERAIQTFHGEPERILRTPPLSWPWDSEWWKPYNFRRDLIKGCALILAELEKFDRQRTRHPSPGSASEPELEERRVHV